MINETNDKNTESQKIEAIFLDRDGTINVEVDLLYKVEDLKLIEGVDKAIKVFNDLMIPVIVVTNQPVVARNLCDEATLQNIHQHLRDMLAEHHAHVDEIYYCPHHPEKNHPDGNPAYRIECECRKPKIGMLKMAEKKFGLNLKNCFMIGDTTTDILTGKNAGCHTILIKTGYMGNDKKHNVKADYEFETLLGAAIFIRKLHMQNQKSH
jgi:histidinol-phosphate phosphatase family protein